MVHRGTLRRTADSADSKNKKPGVACSYTDHAKRASWILVPIICLPWSVARPAFDATTAKHGSSSDWLSWRITDWVRICPNRLDITHGHFSKTTKNQGSMVHQHPTCKSVEGG